MPFRITRKGIASLLVAVAVGALLYHLAPPDISPGHYNANLRIAAPGLSANEQFDVNLVESGSPSEEIRILNGTSTHAEVKVQSVVVIETGSTFTINVEASGTPLASDQIIVILHDDNTFNITLRPTRQSGQNFIIEYQPLVLSKSALMILGVVAVLWFSEGINLVATSILIPILIVLTGVDNATSALSAFFDPAVVLILGGFLIGRALVKYELDRRLALLILSRSTGSGSRLILAVMGATAFLSMWISNTASAAIMIPIALAVITRVHSDEIRSKYGKALVLGVAYAATIGGVASLVGSPPNPLAATYIRSFLGIDFSFVTWLPFGLPVVLIMVPIIWLWLMFRFKVPKDIEEIEDLKAVSEKEYLKMGPMTTEQKVVVLVFLAVVFLWLTQTLPDFIADYIGWNGHGISSAIVALMGGLILLGLGLLDEKDISSHISWSSLLILGSGIALGGAIIDTGVSTYLALQMSGLEVLPTAAVIVIIGIIAVVLTMIASNTAAAVILIPIAIPLAIGLNIDPILITMVIAIGVSLDFALPTGTPPSTIAFSTGKVEMREMITTGLVLDLIATFVLTLGVIWIWALLGLVGL